MKTEKINQSIDFFEWGGGRQVHMIEEETNTQIMLLILSSNLEAPLL